MNESERIERLSPLKRALLSIEKLEAKIEILERAKTEPIAVVGLGCRFPGGVTSPESFWKLLRRGGCAVTEIPADRWDAERHYDPDPTHAGTSYTRRGSFLERVYDFDPLFFGIAPREALSIDPQQRLLLEVAWEALEDAGIAPGDLAGSSAGVFVGIMANDYSRMQNSLRDTGATAYAGTGTADCFAAGRLSYALGLQGASMTVETACSSSLVGIHLACQGLRNGEFDLALAGGVSLMLSPGMFIMASALRAIAADGRSKTFDASADGYGRSEGCGIVVLKRLRDALRDGDRIQALIRGSAVNHDGASGGLTVPNGLAQQAVIRAALRNARVAPHEIAYVEAHGTGTSLGDPIEVRALGAVLGVGRAKERPVMVGSVKTNFGHTEAAAGVAGLIKTVEALRHREIPPHLHLEKPNPLIAWDELPVTIPLQATRFDSLGGPRFAGVSSFSLSGTNAHVILEEAPPAPPYANAIERPVHLLTLSAKDGVALAARREDMAQYLASHEAVPFPDVCFTANAGRSHFSHRVAVVANSHAAAREKLKAAALHASQAPPRIAFLFTGQGSQYAGMARGLYQKSPAFAATVDKAADVIGREIVEVLLGQDGALLEQTRYTQPCLYIMECAVAQMWRGWGIEPEFVMGHSVGEFAAAATSGLFSFEDGLRLMAERGRLMQELPAGGSMLAAMCSESKAALYAEGLSVAAINGPESVVLSGTGADIEKAQRQLKTAGIHNELLRVSHAFHSALMEPMLPAFREAASRVTFGTCRIPIISNLTGKLAISEQLSTPEYWVRHVREAVRFRQGVESLRAEGCNAWIEIGPHPVLVGMARASLSDDALCLPSMRRGRDDWEQMLDSLAKLYTAGANVNWKGFDAGYDRRKVSLPSYPFQRQTYRLEVAESIDAAPGEEHPLPGRRVASALEDIMFETTLAATDGSLLSEHRVFGKSIAPGAWMVAAMIAGAQEILGSNAVLLEETAFEKALVVEETIPRLVQTIFSPDRGQGAIVRVYSQAAGEAQWSLHATARYSVAETPGTAAHPTDRLEFQASATEIRPDDFYKGLRDRAIEHGPRFRRIEGMWRVEGEALGRIAVAPDRALTPGVIDSCIQLMGASLPVGLDDSDAYVPAGIARLVMAQAEPVSELWCEATAHPGTTDGEFRADLKLSGPGGEFIGAIEGLRLRRVSADHLIPVKDVGDWICETRWIASPLYGGTCGFTSTAEPAAALQHEAPKLAAANRLAAYGQLVEDLERQSAVYAHRALRGLSESDVVSSHRRLFGRLREMVAEETGVTDTLTPMDRPDGFDNELDLFAECGRNLAGILTGKVDPLEIIFPGGSTKRIEGVYRDSPYAKATNGLVQTALTNLVGQLPAARGLRVLEIGGGTGGTTAFALSALPADRTDYLFTDVSPALVVQAKEKFASDTRVRVAVLDIEKEPHEAERFDIVLAANVLHATKDLAQTLRHVRKLLRPDGLVVLVEGSGRQRWLDLVFGLTDGWWRFDDSALRNGYPLVEPGIWGSLLEAEGFHAIEWVGTNPDANPAFDQTVLVARAPAAQAGGDGWIVVSDLPADAAALSAHIRECGGECEDVNGSVDYRAAFEAFSKYPDVRWRGVVHAGRGCVSVLRAVKTITEIWPADPPRLWLVTRDAERVAETDTVNGLAESVVWGMAKVIALEHPELRCTCVDLDPAEPPQMSARSLFDELIADSAETLVGFRSGSRYLQRLVRGWSGKPQARRPGDAFELASAERGVLDTLALKPAQRRKPSHGEIEIEVAAAGLNFHDVLEALGMFPDGPNLLGGECVGTVVATGTGVTEFKAGDPVMAVVPGAFARYVTTDKALVIARPPNLDEAEAATVSIAFLTAWHSLVRLAKVKKGDRVLIHAAAGGVGLAAVQIAKRAGAIVFGTAGSDSKRQYVKSQGVDYVLDSRSLEFADQVLRITDGEGVDVVLNSLAGDFIDRSFSVLKAGGRFVEIGKANIRSEREVAERSGGRVEYFIYDLIQHVVDDPATVAESLREIVALAGAGDFKPLCHTIFDIEDAVDAFRFMQRARHTGKIVLRISGAPALAFRPDASYLITGGLSGLGIEVARWMTEKGARELVLMGRGAPKTSAEESIAAIRQAGIRVSVVQGDVSQTNDVARALATATLPLRGVIHSAGVLSDGVILQQTPEKFAEVMAPKVEGAWNLHRQTLNCPLDFFVLFSSAASLLGLPGQSNHAAANAFLDMLACHRRAEGRPGLSINWGAWDQIGAAAGRQATKQARMAGVGSMQPEEGLKALELLMSSRSIQAGVLPIDWSTFARQFSEAARPPFLRDFLDSQVRPAAAEASKSAADSLALSRIKEAPPGDQLGLLFDFVQERAVRILGIDASKSIDPTKPLNELGLDSLMAVELRNALGAAVGRTLPYTVLFEYPTLDALTNYLADGILQLRAPEAATNIPEPEAEENDELEDLSEDDMAALLSRELAALKQKRISI